tara:strand:- start:4736 stop:4861 length:126 start_codon:yes stop_codon:yes gene_type:complete
MVPAPGFRWLSQAEHEPLLRLEAPQQLHALTLMLRAVISQE